MLRAGVWLRHGAGSRFRSCGAARCTAGEVPQIGPSLLSNLKRCFPPLTCARIPGLGAPGMDFARGRLAPVISPAPRCDRCSAFTQQLPELACASADLRASTSWLPQAGTKRQPGRRASGRCKLSSGLLAPLSRPTGSSGWYGRQGAARRSWVRGLVSVHPPRWLPRPPPAAHTAASGAQRHFHHPDDGEDRCSRRCLSRRSG